MAQVTFKLSELDELIKNSDSGVTLVSNCVRQLVLSPFQLQHFKNSIRSSLYCSVAKYDSQLDGIILSYKRIKIEDFFSIQDDGKSKFRYTADIYVFKPKTGSILTGIVNKKGSDHLGCLVHRVFNIAIPRPDNLSDDESWIGSKLCIGQEVQFKVVDVDLNEDMPYIKGEIVNQTGSIYDEELVNEDGVHSYQNEDSSNVFKEKSNEDGYKLDRSSKISPSKNKHSVKVKKSISPDKLKENSNAHNIDFSTSSTLPKKYQKQTKLISNTLNDMYMKLSSKLKNVEGNQGDDDNKNKKHQKSKRVSNDLNQSKEKNSRLSLENSCLNESNIEKTNMKVLKKNKKNKSLFDESFGNSYKLNNSETENESRSNLSHQDNFLVSMNNEISPKKKKKRRSSINENEIQLEKNYTKNVINENSPRKEMKSMLSNNPVNVKLDKSNFTTPERNMAATINSDDVPVEENYRGSGSKKKKAKRKRKSSLIDESNNSTSEQVDGFQQLKQTVTDIFAHSVDSKNIGNIYKTHKKSSDKSKKSEFVSDVEVNNFDQLNYVHKDREHSSGNQSGRKHFYLTDTECSKDVDKLDFGKKKKKKHKDKYSSKEGEPLYKKNNNTTEDIYNLGSLTDSEYVLKESKGKKKKQKKAKNYPINNDFVMDKDISDEMGLTKEDEYHLGSLTDSEYLCKESSRKKKKKRKKERLETNNNDFGSITDTECVVAKKKKKSKHRFIEEYNFSDKTVDKHLSVKDDFNLGSFTDSGFLIGSKKLNKKYHTKFDLDAIRKSLLDGVLKTCKKDFNENASSASEELSFVKKNKKPKVKKKSTKIGDAVDILDKTDLGNKIYDYDKNIFSSKKERKRRASEMSHDNLNDSVSHQKKKKRKSDSGLDMIYLQNELLNNQMKLMKVDKFEKVKTKKGK